MKRNSSPTTLNVTNSKNYASARERLMTSSREIRAIVSVLYLMHNSNYFVLASPSSLTSFVLPARSHLSSGRSTFQTSGLGVLERRAPGLPFPSPFLKNANRLSNRNEIGQNSKIKNVNNFYTEFTKENVLVGIESTSPNSRRISGEMLMDIPIDDIWAILTDYDNLSTHVPNLVESRVIDKSRPRVYQRGAQKIFGFEFGADVTMDMAERIHRYDELDKERPKRLVLDFKCVDSQFFSEFDGSWIVEEYSNEISSSISTASTITMVQYVVDVKPKGPVPVAALEWRIKEDVPTNVSAVSRAARSKMLNREALRKQSFQLQEEKQEQQLRREQITPSIPQTQRQKAVEPGQRRRRNLPLRNIRPTVQPLQQIANRATSFLKQTADSYLPAPASNVAKQALNVLNNATNSIARRGTNDVGLSPFRSFDRIEASSAVENDAKVDGNSNEKATRERYDVEWYEDETMAVYLK